MSATPFLYLNFVADLRVVRRSKERKLARSFFMAFPFRCRGFLIKPCDDLRHNIAAQPFDGAGLMKMRAVARFRDRKWGAFRLDASHFQMGNSLPLQRPVDHLNLDAAPCELIGLLFHGQHPANTWI